ncbi:MAG: hydrolase [Alphaproteobacteria bacterium]|nr:hydrolase [Alphaproteobacteria bacterium]
MLLDAEKSVLCVIDVQKRLAPAMADPDRTVAKSALLMTAAARLDIPVLISEQYPKGLGPTVDALTKIAPEGSIYPKIHFSCVDDPDYRARLDALGRTQAVLTGMEAHVCVLQTALGARGAGYQVAVVADGVTSRDPANKTAALDRMAANGIEIATSEMVVFEWLKAAGSEAFRELSKLIK